MAQVSGGTTQGSMVGRKQETFKSSTRVKDQKTRHRNGRGSEDHAYLGVPAWCQDMVASSTSLDFARPLNNGVPGYLFWISVDISVQCGPAPAMATSLFWNEFPLSIVTVTFSLGITLQRGFRTQAHAH